MMTAHTEKMDHPQGALIFDLDGTLVDTAGDIVYSINHVREMLGLSRLDVENVLEAVGRGTPRLLADMTGIDENDIERTKEVGDEFRRHYLEHQTERSALYPGIRDVLADLFLRYDLFILSNKPHEAVLAELGRHGILSFFKTVWGGDSFRAAKPNPIGIETVIETGAYARQRVVMIGDMSIDVETARNAGVKSCFVTWGFGGLAGCDLIPDIKVSEVTALVSAIDGLLASHTIFFQY